MYTIFPWVFIVLYIQRIQFFKQIHTNSFIVKFKYEKAFRFGIYKVLELGKLKYCKNKINSILFLCLFVDNPQKKKKKVTRYSSLVSLSTIEIK